MRSLMKMGYSPGFFSIGSTAGTGDPKEREVLEPAS